MEEMFQDGRYAVRTIRLNPGFASVVILTLAVAIGLNAATFSVFNTVVLRPLTYPNADRLIWLSTVGTDDESGIVTGPDFADWRGQATSFDGMVAYGSVDYTMATVKGAARVRAAMVTQDFWDISGARPEAGRLPRPEEHEAVLLAHGFAQRWFGGDQDVIGRTVTLDGRQVAIVGVLPADFRFHLPGSPWVGFRPRDVDIYQPMLVSSARGGPVQLLNVVGRLKPGETLEGARAQIAAIRTRAAEANPLPMNDERRLRAVPLHDELIGGAGPALGVLVGAVGCVLLIACANAANLLVARAAARHKEIAVRMSVGAGRARLFRQLLVESLALVVLGSAGGLLLAGEGVAVMLRIDPHAIPRLAETTIDSRVIAGVLAASVLTTIIFGLVSALTLWKVDPHDVLNTGRSVSAPALTSVRMRKILVAGEIALALVLLIATGLMLKSAWRMYAYPVGFEPERILTAKVEFSGPQYAAPSRQVAFADALLGRLRSEPGVEAASISTHGYSLTPALAVEGEPEPPAEEVARRAPIMINFTSAALKQVMGFRLVRGRWFTDGEPAAVLNETLARREFSARDPIGRRIQVSENGPLLTIVGVAADVKYSKLDAPAEPEVYVPYERTDGIYGFTALILTRNDPLTLAPGVRRAVADIDFTQVPDEVMAMEQALGESIAPRRLNLALLGTFSAAALLLALIGVYGVMAFSVTERAHEISVRMALGARRTDVVRMVVRQGMGVTLGGTIAGLVAALTLTRFMESLLYEVEPTDASTFAVITALLAATALLACCVPALKAALIDPMTTLRSE